ncbi:MAG: helix-turn-helix domain-containing protein [Gemmatimonadota bacterium]|nr:helix-turn-helix domain-containing protein [Gemmatimonadota bacterium]
MPSIATLLREEISKIARKEVQDQVRALKQTVREQRDAIARLEKQVGSAKAKAATKPAAAKPATKPATKPAAAKAHKASAGDKRKQLRIAPNTIKKHRKRLKLSQAELGQLLNVSTNTVLRWEAGTSKPRSKHLPGLDQLRTISKRELKKQLGE